MNYKKAIEKRLDGENYSAFASRADINPSGFYQSMKKDNPDFGWKQLLKISKALGVQFSTLAREAAKQTGKGEIAMSEETTITKSIEIDIQVDHVKCEGCSENLNFDLTCDSYGDLQITVAKCNCNSDE